MYRHHIENNNLYSGNTVLGIAPYKMKIRCGVTMRLSFDLAFDTQDGRLEFIPSINATIIGSRESLSQFSNSSPIAQHINIGFISIWQSTLKI